MDPSSAIKLRQKCENHEGRRHSRGVDTICLRAQQVVRGWRHSMEAYAAAVARLLYRRKGRTAKAFHHKQGCRREAPRDMDK
eukprot:5153140-Pleurochrysis_carterae.AAC.1